MLMKPQFFYDHTTKQALVFQNPLYLKKAQELEPKLYDGNVINNMSAIVIPDSEETIMLAEESSSKIIFKQKDPMMLEKKVNTTPVNYAVPQTELSAEQAFWSQNYVNSPNPTLSSRPTKVEVPKELPKNSVNSPEPTISSRPTKVEVPKELPKVSMVNTSLKKLKHHITGFDVVVKERTTPTTITEDCGVPKHPKACFRYAKLIQELLTHISKTCPSVNNTDGKLVAVTPNNKDKRVRFTEPVTSSGYTINKTASTSNLCNGCMLSDNHDLCVLDFINNMNAHKKSKSVKKSSKRKVWKPTGKVFTNIGYIWRPTGWTFTIVGNVCPLTRITTTAEVPLRKPTALENETPKHVVTLVYSRKPRKSQTNVPVSKSKVLKSVSANKKEPNQSWGSIVSDVPSSSSLRECSPYQIVLLLFGLCCSKHMTEDRSQSHQISSIMCPVSSRPYRKALTLAVQKDLSVSKEPVNRDYVNLKDSSIALTAFADADHVGCQDTTVHIWYYQLQEIDLLAFLKRQKKRCDLQYGRD
ncbi:hypothetical protein Tco_0277492 [Tanacetum coccineum]